MATFDRFDIVEAHCVLEWDYNLRGWLQERPSNWRRREATAVQLSRMHFRPAFNLSFDTLSDNAKEIYLHHVLDWNLPRDAELNQHIKDMFAEDWLETDYPVAFAEIYH